MKTLLFIFILLFITFNASAAQNFHCYAYTIENKGDYADVEINNQKIIMTERNSQFIGALNRNIPDEEGFIHFTGYYRDSKQRIATWILVENSLLEGKPGILIVPSRGEGFYETHFDCK